MMDLHRIDDKLFGTINDCVNMDHPSKDLKSNLVKKRSKSQTILWLKNKFFESGCVVFEDECETHPIDKCFQISLPSFDKFQFQSSIFAHNCHTLMGYLSFDNIIKNICSLRTAYVSKIALPILHHLMTDKRNMNMFNDPVDPIKLNVPQYFEIITTPMDLGTVKGKLRGGHYQSLQSCFSDIELVFTNAMRFNSSDHVVHRWARELLLEFRSEVNLAFDKCSKEVRQCSMTDYVHHHHHQPTTPAAAIRTSGGATTTARCALGPPATCAARSASSSIRTSCPARSVRSTSRRTMSTSSLATGAMCGVRSATSLYRR